MTSGAFLCRRRRSLRRRRHGLGFGEHGRTTWRSRRLKHRRRGGRSHLLTRIPATGRRSMATAVTPGRRLHELYVTAAQVNSVTWSGADYITIEADADLRCRISTRHSGSTSTATASLNNEVPGDRALPVAYPRNKDAVIADSVHADVADVAVCALEVQPDGEGTSSRRIRRRSRCTYSTCRRCPSTSTAGRANWRCRLPSP